MTDAYEALPKTAANYVSLTPVSFLERTADLYPDRPALKYHESRYSWDDVRRQCHLFASALEKAGIGRNDTVSLLTFNTPEMFLAHFAVPISGGVLNTINTRLDAATIAYIIDHAETKLFIVDRELYPVLGEALKICVGKPKIVVIDDPHAAVKPVIDPSGLLFPEFLKTGNPDYSPPALEDEWRALSLNYTSGTTGHPKGVIYHHRGAYLMSMGTVATWGLPPHPNYLYTVPMFHCNGWGHAWTMTLLAGTVTCLRYFDPKSVFELIERDEITHFGGAPVVLNMLANAPEADKKYFDRPVEVMTAGAPPPASVLAAMGAFNFNVMHVYGLTETYGHILGSCPQANWAGQPSDTLADLKARQGLRFAMTELVDVLDPEGKPIPHDGETMGEIVIRGNTVMKGYLKDAAATEAALGSGWFVSGDLGVIYPDGYIQLKDRAKDIIISGGENISSVEVENALYRHEAVGEAAVVAMPDDKWGEVPCAFVELKPDATIAEETLIAFCADEMARFKRPKKIIFGPLPKTATGKIQKKQLRDQAKMHRD